MKYIVKRANRPRSNTWQNFDISVVWTTIVLSLAADLLLAAMIIMLGFVTHTSFLDVYPMAVSVFYAISALDGIVLILAMWNKWPKTRPSSLLINILFRKQSRKQRRSITRDSIYLKPATVLDEYKQYGLYDFARDRLLPIVASGFAVLPIYVLLAMSSPPIPLFEELLLEIAWPALFTLLIVGNSVLFVWRTRTRQLHWIKNNCI
jgi:hypothetical protein